jgi:hypothetical protein
MISISRLLLRYQHGFVRFVVAQISILETNYTKCSWKCILLVFNNLNTNIFCIIMHVKLDKMKIINCRNPTLAKCGGEAQHLEKLGVGVLRDSWMFRARQQGAKHLTLGCSWCRWKGLETKISKMASHWPFGHLQPKLWAKEGPGVKLAVWLPTTKSRESTSSRCPIRECDMALKRYRRGLQLWFRPRRDPTL